MIAAVGFGDRCGGEGQIARQLTYWQGGTAAHDLAGSMTPCILLALAQSAPARLGGKITLRTGAGSLTFRSIADKMGEIPIEGERGDEYSLGER